MKAKVYPISYFNNDVEAIYSSFCLQFEILCASLASGVSVINGIINNKEIKTTIEWCSQFGASIRKNGSSLVIKGVNGRIDFKNNFFTSDSNVAPKMFIPVFCTVNQQIGLKLSSSCFKEISALYPIFDAFEVSYYAENNVIRFEKVMSGADIEIDGDTDVYFVGGLMLACALLKSNSKIRLRAPIRNENNYKTILKILKKFNIEIKHPASMQYDIAGFQKLKGCRIKTENDGIQLCHMLLLSQILENEKAYMKFKGYHANSLSSDTDFYRNLRDNITLYKRFNRTYRKKEISIEEVDLRVDDSLPFLMILGTLNDRNLVINKLDLNKARIKNQLNLMSSAFNKLGLTYELKEEKIIINPHKVLEKKQIDCGNNPYVCMSLVFLALLSNAPIVILNAQCMENINSDIFTRLKDYGAHIEFIYD